MDLSLDETNRILRIKLSPTERFLAFRLRRDIEIPLSSITGASTDPPESTWLELRAPGTFIPGLIKAGTYYTRRGREFWYATRRRGFLVLDLDGGRYRRVVLTPDDNEAWAEKLGAP